MRTFISALATGVLLAGSAIQLQAQDALTIGYVDSGAVLQEAPGVEEAQQELDRQAQEFSAEIDRMSLEIDSLITAYQQQQSTLLPAARQARESEIREIQQRYQQRAEQIQQEAEEGRAALINPILERMTTAIEAIREERGYDFIFDAASQSILSADPTLDLTQDVLLRMRQAEGVGFN